jgi:hypothetical protein
MVGCLDACIAGTCRNLGFRTCVVLWFNSFWWRIQQGSRALYGCSCFPVRTPQCSIYTLAECRLPLPEDKPNGHGKTRHLSITSALPVTPWHSCAKHETLLSHIVFPLIVFPLSVRGHRSAVYIQTFQNAVVAGYLTSSKHRVSMLAVYFTGRRYRNATCSRWPSATPKHNTTSWFTLQKEP